jgi:hypothetical protein
VKSSKAPAGQNRDRAYWEPPRAGIARLEGHVEEIAPGEQLPTPTTGRGGRLRSVLEDRRAQLGLGALCVILIAGLLTLGPLATSSSATPSPSATEVPSVPVAAASPGESASASAEPSASPTYSPSPYVWYMTPSPGANATLAPTPNPNLLSFSTRGWPIELEDTGISSYDSVVGPDGTLFVYGFPGFDKAGHARSGWLARDGSHAQPYVFGTDGTTYAVEYSDDQTSFDVPDHLYAFDTSGKLRSGWPIEIASGATLDAGPSGSVYVFEYEDLSTTVTVYSPQAKKLASWSFGDMGTDCGEVVKPDGSLYFEYSPSDSATDCAIRVFTATGTSTAAAPARGWNGIEMSPDGLVVAWGYDMQPYSTSIVARTRIAVIGTDGLPVAGWPVTIEGGASKPAFGADGTLYVTVLGLGTAPSRIMAIDATGTAVPGWPVALPAGYGPMIDSDYHPLPPVPGDNGMVYAAAVDRDQMGYVTAFDATGATLPGWPYELPQAFGEFDDGGQIPLSNPGPLFVRPASASGLLYLILDDRVVALRADGTVAPGWPYVLPASYTDGRWVTAAPMPDGGLMAIIGGISAADAGDEAATICVAFRWTPSGTMPR